LGGKLIDISTLTADECALLLGFITMADKAAAHFMLRKVHPWERTSEGIEWIHHHLRVNLYGAAAEADWNP